eukprot:TRINITY_DN6524_c0_g3_i3.p1 TRINITY_DN6524_c0_g3~~TRINITY_DN6524_c0_g3_i3.p1  ORF type:complete len:282 (+),score=47.37 TRINITY_DN6524_c0_g3_i3:463-1308(+)
MLTLGHQPSFSVLASFIQFLFRQRNWKTISQTWHELGTSTKKDSRLAQIVVRSLAEIYQLPISERAKANCKAEAKKILSRISSLGYEQRKLSGNLTAQFPAKLLLPLTLVFLGKPSTIEEIKIVMAHVYGVPSEGAIRYVLSTGPYRAYRMPHTNHKHYYFCIPKVKTLNSSPRRLSSICKFLNLREFLHEKISMFSHRQCNREWDAWSFLVKFVKPNIELAVDGDDGTGAGAGHDAGAGPGTGHGAGTGTCHGTGAGAGAGAGAGDGDCGDGDSDDVLPS